MNLYAEAFRWLLSQPVNGRDRFHGVTVVRLDGGEFIVAGVRCRGPEIAANWLCRELTECSLMYCRTEQ